MKLIRPVCLLAALLLGGPLFSATPPSAAPDPAAALAARRKLAEALHYEKGIITLHNGLARLALPEDYRYLNPADTTTLLTKIWGNPNGDGTLGTIVPASFDPLGDESWAVIVTFDEDGYVKDDDAAKVNYTDLLKEMRAGTRRRARNASRKATPRSNSSAGPPRRAMTPPPTSSIGPRKSSSATSRSTRSTTTSACWAGGACWS